MKCPKCIEEGEKSIVYPAPYFTSTLMFSQDYFDEDGERHSHDLNSQTGEYSCNRGHRWFETRYPKCRQCGWVAGESKVWHPKEETHA